MLRMCLFSGCAYFRGVLIFQIIRYRFITNDTVVLDDLGLSAYMFPFKSIFIAKFTPNHLGIEALLPRYKTL